MRDRARALMMQGIDHESPYGSPDVHELMSLAMQHGELQGLVAETIQHCIQFLKRNVRMYVCCHRSFDRYTNFDQVRTKQIYSPCLTDL